VSATCIRSNNASRKRREAIVEGIKRQFNGSAGAGERRRRAELAKIHLQAKELGLDTDTYRDVLRLVAGVDSAADLDASGRRRVIEHFNAKLGVASAHRTEAPHNLAGKPLLAKIEALLADGDKPWSYAEALARRICRRDRLAFCSDVELRKIIAALSYDQQRRASRGIPRDA
jgi:phage gp16-like protein